MHVIGAFHHIANSTPVIALLPFDWLTRTPMLMQDPCCSPMETLFG